MYVCLYVRGRQQAYATEAQTHKRKITLTQTDARTHGRAHARTRNANAYTQKEYPFVPPACLFMFTNPNMTTLATE